MGIMYSEVEANERKENNKLFHFGLRQCWYTTLNLFFLIESYSS